MLKRKFLNFSLMLLLLVVSLPLLAEFFLRAGIALKIEQFRRPSLYADYTADDDYWKLAQDWRGGYPYKPPSRVHPILGWSQAPVSTENPLGLQKSSLERMASNRSKIFFYGDSFVKGESAQEYEIPEYLHHQLKDIDVVDLGGGGYGIDQIYLMFNQTYQEPNVDFFIVGIFTYDLNRIVLSIRTSQKPYFEFDDRGELQLRGIPIEKDQESYFKNYEMKQKSFLWALIKTKLGLHDDKQTQKKEIAKELLKRFKQDSESVHTKMVVVLFYLDTELKNVEWRESWLKSTLAELDIESIDTKKILLDYAQKNGVDVEKFYVGKHGHHNNLGNQVIAEGILEYLEQSILE